MYGITRWNARGCLAGVPGLRAERALCLLVVLAGIPCLLADSAAGQQLPKGWFAQYAAGRNQAGLLPTPAEEVWRCQGSGLESIFVKCSEGKIFVKREVMSPELAMAAMEAMASRSTTLDEDSGTDRFLTCRDVLTGQVLWDHKFDRGDQPGANYVPFAGYVMVYITHRRPVKMWTATAPTSAPASRPRRIPVAYTESIWIFDAANGQVVKRFGPRPWTLMERNSREMQRLARMDKTKSDRYGAVIEHRDKIVGSYYGANGPVSPIPDDMSMWTQDDAQLLLDILNADCVPLYGRTQRVLIGDATHMIEGTLNGIICSDPSSSVDRWSQPGGALWILWHPPLVAKGGMANLIAYEIESGKMLWEHRMDFRRGYCPNVTLIGNLEDGFLLLSDPATGEQETGKNYRIWLTKLDLRGQMVFQQALDLTPGHQDFLFAHDRLVVFDSNGEIACYAPTKKLPSQFRVPTAEERKKVKIEELHKRYDQESLLRRLGVCAMLAELGDKTIIDRVLADWEKAPRPEKCQYFGMIATLHAYRAIPKLLDLLDSDDEEIRQAAAGTISRMTGTDAVHRTPAQVRAWWEEHKREFHE